MICDECSNIINDNPLKCSVCSSVIHQYCKKRECRKSSKDYTCVKCQEITVAHVFQLMNTKFASFTQIISRVCSIENSVDFIANTMNNLINQNKIIENLSDEIHTLSLKIEDLTHKHELATAELKENREANHKKNVKLVQKIDEIHDLFEDATFNNISSSDNVNSDNLKSILINLKSEVTSSFNKLNKDIITKNKFKVDNSSQTIINNTCENDTQTCDYIIKSQSPITESLDPAPSILDNIMDDSASAPTNTNRETENSELNLIPVQPRKWIFLSRLNKTVTDEQIHHHINQFLKIKGANPIRMPEKTVNGIECDYASYRISTPESYFNTLVNPQSWPPGLLVQEFIWRQRKNPFRIRSLNTHPT